MRIQPHEVIPRLTKQVVRSVRGIKASTPIRFIRPFGNNTYLFQRGTQGLITITEDDPDLPLVLADCDIADFSAELPPNLNEWLMAIDEEINAYLKYGISDLTEDAADSRVPISPIIKSKWAQGTPFNNALFIDGKYRQVGCNATAMGQLLRHFGCEGIDGIKYKRGCKKTPIYTTRTLGIKIASMPPKAVFDYSRLTQKAPTATDSINAVATFLAYCSKSITSDFKESSTAASPTYVSQVLRTYFKMGEVELIGCSQVGAAAFEERIYNELLQGYPVIINGYNEKTGHCFLCDGYDGNGKYHFNLGWGGVCDGYYRLSALNPKKNGVTLNYNDRKTIIVVHPVYQWGDVNGDGKVDISDVTTVVNDVLNSIYREEGDINNDKCETISDATLIANHIVGKKIL